MEAAETEGGEADEESDENEAEAVGDRTETEAKGGEADEESDEYKAEAVGDGSKVERN